MPPFENTISDVVSFILELVCSLLISLFSTQKAEQVKDNQEERHLTSASEKAESSPEVEWPNDLGFDTVREEREPITLPVVGHIPAYAAGTIYRNGPGTRQLHGEDGKLAYEVSHWFDGFGQLHKFELVLGSEGIESVRYSSRFTVDTLMEELKKTGHFSGYTFAQKRDPCMGFFRKTMCLFTPTPRDSPTVTNVPVTISANPTGFPLSSVRASAASQGHKIGTFPFLIARTDESSVKAIDPDTLEPIGIAKQSSLHPLLRGPLSASHAKSDPDTGDVYNYNLDLGKDAVYRVFCTSAATAETKVLATIYGRDIPPAYMHSFFLTDNFVVLAVWGAHLRAGGLRVLWEKNVLDAIAPFDSAKPTQWFVVDRRHGRGVVARFASAAAFCFHTVNAYELPSCRAGNNATATLVCDLIEYPNLDMLHKFYYSNLRSSSPDAHAWLAEKAVTCQPKLTRYELPSVPIPSKGNTSLPPLTQRQRERAPPPLPPCRRAERRTGTPVLTAGELPTLNPTVAGKPYRFAWCCDFSAARSTFIDGLTKVDVHTHETLRWERQGHTPGEAIFVPDPNGGGAEDAGVLLTVVLDGFAGSSYLLCLDARTMTEMGRADMAAPLAFTFHGQHVPASGARVVDM